MITRNRYVLEDMSGKYSNTIRAENVCRPNAHEVYIRPKLTAKWIPGVRDCDFLDLVNATEHRADRGTSRFMDTVNKSFYVPSLPPRISAGEMLGFCLLTWNLPSNPARSYIHLFDVYVIQSRFHYSTMCARCTHKHTSRFKINVCVINTRVFHSWDDYHTLMRSIRLQLTH